MKLQNLILLTTLLSSTALADGGDFYTRLKLGRFHPESVSNITSKPVIAPAFAFGYNISDDARVDLSIEHFSYIKHVGSVHKVASANSSCPATPYAPPSYDQTEGHNNEQNEELRPLCTHAKITSVKVNTFLDLMKIKNSSIFIGVGLGFSRHNGFIADNTVVNESYGASYDAHFGISQKILDDVNIEVGYTFQHLMNYPYNYRGHNISTSLRIDL